ncbi:MAG: hypothetical protein AAF555_05705 [Verrucomicrobiota bacterium]
MATKTADAEAGTATVEGSVEDALSDEVWNVLGAEEGFVGDEVPEDEPRAIREADEPEEETDADEEATEDEMSEEATEDEAEVDADEESAADDKNEEEDSKAQWPEAARERIGKLKRQRDEARENSETLQGRVSELEQNLETLQSRETVTLRSERNPLLEVASSEELATRLEQTEAHLQWALDHEDGGEVRLEGGAVREFTPEEVAAIKKNAEAVLKIHGPRHEKFLAARAQAREEAKGMYPELFQAGTDAAQAREALQKQMPGLLELPNSDLLIGDHLLGRLVREGKVKVTVVAQKGKAGDASKVKAKVKRPRSTASGKAAPAPKKPDASTAAMRRFEQDPSNTDALVDALAAGDFV